MKKTAFDTSCLYRIRYKMFHSKATFTNYLVSADSCLPLDLYSARITVFDIKRRTFKIAPK